MQLQLRTIKKPDANILALPALYDAVSFLADDTFEDLEHVADMSDR